MKCVFAEAESDSGSKYGEGSELPARQDISEPAALCANIRNKTQKESPRHAIRAPRASIWCR